MKIFKFLLALLLVATVSACGTSGALVPGSKRNFEPSLAIKSASVSWIGDKPIRISSGSRGEDISYQSSKFVSDLSAEFRERAPTEISKGFLLSGVGQGKDALLTLQPVFGSFGKYTVLNAGGGYVIIQAILTEQSTSRVLWQAEFKVFGEFGESKGPLLMPFVNSVISELKLSNRI